MRRIHAKERPKAAIPTEEMACPACDDRFLFGSECPDCEVDLVSESLLGRPEDDLSEEIALIRRDKPSFVGGAVWMAFLLGVCAALGWLIS